MPAVYDSLGVRFLYPENWTLDDGTDDEAGPDEKQNSVSIYSPGGAFWSLAIYPPNQTPTDLAAEVMRALRGEYQDMDVATVTEAVEGQDLVGYDMNFIYLDLTNTASVRALHTPRATYVVYYQSEDRELAEIKAVFDAMLASFLREIG
ncbi:MAG: hypothetical protein DCC68_09380 [Planctomycetota bacterium]|nr:MAG: hypothetical protein DCC68_09380 [Planctomycetota bacterium]